MSTVYVVQRQHMLDKVSGELVPKFDLTAAERFGDLRFLLSPSTRPFNPNGVVDKLREELRGYESSDYLLLIGNPALIGFVVAIAADYSDGFVRLLQWSGSKRLYISIEVDLKFGVTA